MEKNLLKGVDKSDFLLYKSPDGEIKVEVFLWNETIWLTQKRMGGTFLE